MKKSALRTIAAAFAISLTLSAASCKNTDEYAPPAGYTLASNENADYCLYVPDKWTVDMSTAAAGAYYSATDPSSVSVMGWDLQNYDSSLDEWWETNKTDLALVFTDFNEISEENTTLDELYAKRYTYTAKLGENSYKFLQEAAIKDGYVYVFTYTSLEDTFDSHLAEVEEILGYMVIK